MSEFWACVIAEFRALGAWCMIHGPEIWLAIAKTAVMLGVFDLGVLAGMYISALMGANREDCDEHKDDL